MALNLKRKRTQDSAVGGRKKRQVTPEEDEVDGLSNYGFDQDGEEDVDSKEEGSSGEESEGAEEWSGLDGDVQNGAQAQGGNDDEEGHRPHKPPTGEELRNIKEATDLFRSNSFKLQIDVLLPNVRPKPNRIAPLERFLQSLYTFLTSLQPIEPQHPLAAARNLQNNHGLAVPYPLPLPTEDTNWKVQFEPPNEVLLVGSWANKCSVRGVGEIKYGVDLAVEMPSGLFQEKDYMNGRFFHKRAFYLACIASCLLSHRSQFNVDVYYESTSDDPRLTTLILRPRKDGSNTDFNKLSSQIRIIPTLSTPPPFPLHRLSPSHSSVRLSSPSSSTPPPTPLYNTAVLLTLTPKPHLLSSHALKSSVPAFQDALTLLRVWANQRGYGEARGAEGMLCVRGFEGKGAWWAGLLEVLVKGEEERRGLGGAGRRGGKGKVGKGLSSYQMFRAALDFLSRHDWEKDKVFVKSNNGHRYPPEQYEAHHEAVFVDSSSLVNLLADVPLSSLELLRHDAQLTLDRLDNSLVTTDIFTDVFLKDQRNVQTRFDAIIRVDISSAKLREPSDHAIADYGSPQNALLASLASLVRQGLGNRTKAIGILHPSSQSRSLAQAHPSASSTVFIGLIYDSEHAFRLVDHGPSADSPDEAAVDRFRNYWGDKAELRRFKDGSITESVVWDVKNADERAHIPVMVVRHVLMRHFGLRSDAMTSWQQPYDALLKLPESITQVYQTLRVQTGFKTAMTAFDELVKTLKADEDLPLSVTTVSPVSEYLRYTGVFAPVSLAPATTSALPQCARYAPVMDIVLEFEKSGQWPDDLRAIQKMKLAFFERIASSLMRSIEGAKASVVVGDPGASEIQDQARLEIVTPDGWAFSARIRHDREATLLDRIINEKSHINKKVFKQQQQDEGKAKERKEALVAREMYLRRFVHAPRHHRAIAALCHRYSAYAGTVRLVKRWFASHWLLHGHISEEAVEVICASMFLRVGRLAQTNEGAHVPGSKERGFARVIEFLKDWNWENGLFVPLYRENEGDEASQAEEVKVNIVAGSMAGVWTISTEQDRAGHMWTSSGPATVAANRVKDLAKATWNVLGAVNSGDSPVQAMFLHPSDDYDFIVELDSAALPRYFQHVAADSAVWARKSKYANLSVSDEVPLCLRPGFDPAFLFFDDLKRTYADTYLIFFDPCGGDRLGAVWNPSLRNARPFRVLGGFSGIPVPKEEKTKEKDTVLLNKDAVLSEIQRLGSGLVKGITLQI